MIITLICQRFFQIIENYFQNQTSDFSRILFVQKTKMTQYKQLFPLFQKTSSVFSIYFPSCALHAHRELFSSSLPSSCFPNQKGRKPENSLPCIAGTSFTPASLLYILVRHFTMIFFTAGVHKESPVRQRMPHRQNPPRTAASHSHILRMHLPQRKQGWMED